LPASHVLDFLGEVVGDQWWGKFGPDGGSIGVTRIADFCQYIFDVQGDLSIGSSYCRSDKHDALALGVRVEAVIHNQDLRNWHSARTD